MKKRLLIKLRRWLALEEPRWWDLEDPGPVTVIQGMPLISALRHRRAGA